MSRTEPGRDVRDPHALLSAQLDYYRATLLRKLEGLTEEQLRVSGLPSGWSPLELVWHLAHVERRWLVWGFLAEDVPDPWADSEDSDGNDRWRIPDGTSTAQVFDTFARQCARSRKITEGAPLDAVAAVGGRFPTEAEAPNLAWILLHLLQEYARHTGQLDVVRELSDGATGE